MTMTPGLRKLVLTAHVASSVGWLGAVAAVLALDLVALTSRDDETVRAAYLATESITWVVLVPLALTSLLIGVVNALGTTWGLFRHWWVVAKLLLTIVATIVLLLYTQTIGDTAAVAAEMRVSGADLRALARSPVLHAGAALLVLLVTTVLAVYKPHGMTRYGWRKAQEERRKLYEQRTVSRP
jgi:DMSO/TMAO reductase YedYZ heme-binding membrane subunit